MGEENRGTRHRDQCKCANVQRWKGEDKWTSGRVGEWDREMQDAVQKCKGGKEDEMVSGARCQVSGNEGVFYLQFLKFF